MSIQTESPVLIDNWSREQKYDIAHYRCVSLYGQILAGRMKEDILSNTIVLDKPTAFLHSYISLQTMNVYSLGAGMRVLTIQDAHMYSTYLLHSMMEYADLLSIDIVADKDRNIYCIYHPDRIILTPSSMKLYVREYSGAHRYGISLTGDTPVIVYESIVKVPICRSYEEVKILLLRHMKYPICNSYQNIDIIFR